MDLNASPNPMTFSCSFSVQMSQFEQLFTQLKPGSMRQTTITATYAEEVVELLTEQIERRTSWDHERLLFSAHNDDQHLYQPIQVKLATQLILLNSHENIQEQAEEKGYQMHHIKTPDLIPDSDLSNYENFTLEKQKKEEKESVKKVHCNCKKSKCLKMYCECFRNGETCDGCQCCDCGNFDSAEEQRERARSRIQQKQPGAFLDIFKYKGCRCTKSNCQKGYCECFASGLICGKYCECRDCNNCSNYRKNKQKKHHQKVKRSKRHV